MAGSIKMEEMVVCGKTTECISDEGWLEIGYGEGISVGGEVTISTETI